MLYSLPCVQYPHSVIQEVQHVQNLTSHLRLKAVHNVVCKPYKLTAELYTVFYHNTLLQYILPFCLLLGSADFFLTWFANCTTKSPDFGISLKCDISTDSFIFFKEKIE